MIERYYFDLIIENGDKVLISKAYRLIHGIFSGMGEHRPQVGLAFPYWQPGLQEDFLSMGDTIRIVGEKHEVNRLFKHTEINNLCENPGFFTTAILEVPATAKEVIYKRNRIIERKWANSKKPNVDKKYAKMPEVLFPFIALSSVSSKQNYRLTVEEIPAEKRVDGPFTTYGLSSGGTTVPKF